MTEPGPERQDESVDNDPPLAEGARFLNHPGIRIVLGDRATWILPYCLRGSFLQKERDQLADLCWSGRPFTASEIQGIALSLLSLAYDRETIAIAQAIVLASPKLLLDAVLGAILIPNSSNDAGTHRTYSDWLNGGLAANGLSADKITDELLPHVVKHLVDCGRMCPPERFISSAIGLRVRQELLGSFEES